MTELRSWLSTGKGNMNDEGHEWKSAVVKRGRKED